MSSDGTLLGMPLDVGEGAFDGTTPLVGFAAVKLLDAEGKVCYRAVATTGMTSAECLGLARWAVLGLERGLAAEQSGRDDG